MRNERAKSRPIVTNNERRSAWSKIAEMANARKLICLAVVACLATSLTGFSPQAWGRPQDEASASLQTSPADIPVEPLELVPSDEQVNRQLNAVLPMLGAVNYRSREEASAALKAIGVAAFPRLRDAYVATDDLEVRYRVRTLVEWLFHEQRVYSQKAFLGVQLSAHLPNTYPEDVPVDRTEHVLFLSRVIPNTAASLAGLTQSDIVLALNGRKPDANNQPDTHEVGIPRGLVNDFSRNIAGNKPGDTIDITYYRDGVVETVPVELGMLPEDMRQNSNVAAIEKAMTESRDIFDRWWQVHFENASLDDAD